MTRSRPIIPRNNPVAVVSRTASWRWAWAAAQVTPVLFSSYVWLIIGTLQPLLMELQHCYHFVKNFQHYISMHQQEYILLFQVYR